MQRGAEKEDAGVVVVQDMANHDHHHHHAVVTISGASLDDAADEAAGADEREKRATAVVEAEAVGGGGGGREAGGGGDRDGAGGDTCQIADDRPGGPGSQPIMQTVGGNPLDAPELAAPADVAAIPKQEESELGMAAAAAPLDQSARGAEPAPEPAVPVNDDPPQQSSAQAAGSGDQAQYQVTSRSLGVGARPSSREDADKKLQYALRSNPKRSRRFFDQDYALDGQLVAQAVNNNTQPQVAGSISSSCPAAALISIPAISSPAGPPPAVPLKKTSVAATSFTSAFSQDSSEARACTECGKQFPSWKALFGHMRCHPERQWRGIQPPSSTNPNHIAAAKNSNTTRFKDHASSHYTNHKGTSPNQSSRESESENCTTRAAAGAGTNAGHNIHRHRRDHHQQQLQLDLEVEEESDTESIEAAYMNGRDQESPSWMRGKRSRRCRQALRSLQSVVTAAAAAGRVVSDQSNSPPADDHDGYTIGSTDSQKQLQSRTMINRDQELEPAKTDDDQDHGRGAGDIRLGLQEEEDKIIADHERDMADCLVMLAFAAKRKGADDQQLSECDSGVMLDGMMIGRDARPAGGVVNGEESSEEMDWEGHITSSKLTFEGTAALDHKLDGRLIPEHHQFYTHKINPSAGSGPKSRLVAPKLWEREMEKGGWDMHKKSKFECSTCKKTFRSHQALGGHRASHKKVKGCFARTNTPAGNEEDNINTQTNSTVLQADQAEMMMVMRKVDQGLQEQQQQGEDGAANVNALILSINKSSCPRSAETEPGLHQDHYQYHDIHQLQAAANSDHDQAAMIRIDSRIQLLQCSISCNEKMEDDLMEPGDTAMTLSLQGDKPKQKLRYQTSSCSSSSIMAAGTLLMHHQHHQHHGHHQQQSSSSQQQVPKIHQCTICHRVFSTGQALGGHKRCHWGGSSSSGGPPDAAVQVMKKGKQESPSRCGGDVTQNAAAANCSLGLNSTINSGCSELMSKKLVRQESGSFNTNTSGWPAMGASVVTEYKACDLSISRKGSELPADDQAMADANSSHPQNWTLGGASPATQPKSSFEFKKMAAGAEDQTISIGVCDIHSANSKKEWFRAELNLCNSSRSQDIEAQGLLAGISHMIATTSTTTTDEDDDERAIALALQSASNSSTGLSIMQLAPPVPHHHHPPLLNPNGRSVAAATAAALKDDLIDLNLPAPIEEDEAVPDHSRSYRPL